MRNTRLQRLKVVEQSFFDLCRRCGRYFDVTDSREVLFHKFHQRRKTKTSPRP